MSERPDEDRVNVAGKAAVAGAAPGPGGGGPAPGGGGPAPGGGGPAPGGGGPAPGGGGPAPGQKGAWSGDAKYPDGFTMDRAKDGRITLTDPDRTTAEWDHQRRAWVNPDTHAPMPADWSGGHYPGTADLGQGTPPAHPSGADKPQG